VEMVRQLLQIVWANTYVVRDEPTEGTRKGANEGRGLDTNHDVNKHALKKHTEKGRGEPDHQEFTRTAYFPAYVEKEQTGDHLMMMDAYRAGYRHRLRQSLHSAHHLVRGDDPDLFPITGNDGKSRRWKYSR
jgi:hypothetical protein